MTQPATPYQATAASNPNGNNLSPLYSPTNGLGNGGLFGGSPALSDFGFANPAAFTGQYTPAVYGAINQGFQNSTGASPLSAYTTLNTNATNGYANSFNGYIQQLQNMANGKGPSLAAVQAQQTSQAQAANTMAQIASARGSSNPATALRTAQDTTAANNQQAVQAAVQGRTNEEIQAQGLLGTGINNAYTQAAGTAATQAGLTQNTNTANLQAQTANNQLNAQQYAAMVTALGQQNQQDISNQAAYQQLIGQQQLGIANVNAGISSNNANNAMGLTGAGISGTAAIGAAGLMTL